jgi:hypothetical protein
VWPRPRDRHVKTYLERGVKGLPVKTYLEGCRQRVTGNSITLPLFLVTFWLSVSHFPASNCLVLLGATAALSVLANVRVGENSCALVHTATRLFGAMEAASVESSNLALDVAGSRLCHGRRRSLDHRLLHSDRSIGDCRTFATGLLHGGGLYRRRHR